MAEITRPTCQQCGSDMLDCRCASTGKSQMAEMVAFEEDIVAEFEAGRIKAPVHLAGGNERQLLNVFRGCVDPDDWVLCSWRSHYHCLLKGVPPAELKAAIMAGHSIALCFPEHKILSSAIVGGICPIAIGLGWAIKERGGNQTVHVFIGDMTARTGIYHECLNYCRGHDLPVRFWVENNHLSVSTKTNQVWPQPHGNPERIYEYEMTVPHVGIGKWVAF